MSCASECVGRCKGGSILVEGKEIVDQIVIEAEGLTPSERKICHNIAKDCTTPKSCPPGKGCRQHSHISTVPDDDPDFDFSKPWLNSKIVENLQIQSNPDTRVIKECYDALLNTEDLYKEDFKYLAMDQLVLNRRRQEMLHKRWSENVYDPIRCAVEKEMNSCKFLEIQERKKQLYKEYLEYVNRKGYVFREVFDPVEYYPLGLTSSLQARTGPLNDPLLFQERERNREDAVAFRLATGCSVRCKDAGKIRLPVLPLVPLGRHGASWKKLTDMHLGQIDSDVRTLCRRKVLLNRNHSNVIIGDEENDDEEKFFYVNIRRHPSGLKRDVK